MCNKEKLKTLAHRFRKAISSSKKGLYVTLQDFPNGACGDASYLLAKYFQENDCGQFEYVLGERVGYLHSHAWLERSGLIVDITADQFDGQEIEVLVTSDHSWHLQFEENERHIADFERYDKNTVANLRESYHKVLNAIKTQPKHAAR